MIRNTDDEMPYTFVCFFKEIADHYAKLLSHASDRGDLSIFIEIHNVFIKKG